MRHRIRVTGTVQGVGFRPFVYRHARRLGLCGWVQNDREGVLLEVQGAEPDVLELARLLVDEPPPLARVGSVTAGIVPLAGEHEFVIVASGARGAATAPVSIDTATCAACLAEVDDPTDRRYRYPFTNCTDCGPRYTIVREVPYDRPGTTMAGFTMCAPCQAEYDDPGDRRFHAQPNACPRCGPALGWTEGPGFAGGIVGDAALDAAVDALQRGAIVAVKGIGGFHLAVDATDEAAVAELRHRKARDDKPFAVMVADLDAAHALCHLSPAAVTALAGPGRPIVLAPRRAAALVAAGVAPGLVDLGLLLAYSPLHHLLLRAVGRPLVMTSGNLSDEPIAHEDHDARTRLSTLVDGLLGHDRGIHIRCDDSVVRALPGDRIQVLRRSRGLAPEPLPLVRTARQSILALGAELKSTVAVTLGDAVVASHHIGDLEHLATYRSFLQAIDHLRALYAVTPELVAHDLHPEYLSSKLAADLDLPTLAVQHHHAHVASLLTEHRRAGPVLALAFDGLGYGTDGTLWGGELLVADLQAFERVGHLLPIAMPGGSAAIREPWRMAVAWAHQAGVDHAVDDPRHAAVRDLAARARGPVTTSVGRLFDAVAALLGLRPTVSYEAQAAIELEALARRVPRAEASALTVTVDRGAGDRLVIDPRPAVAALVRQRAEGADPARLAAGFHEALGAAAARAAIHAAREHGLR
ncbi:MAG: carbamoyltransferase HypF [Acidimicrobiales bacterium]